MEEKTTKLNNIMNKKVNMDFFKNMMSPIKIPKLKSRKIFNTKAPAKPDNDAQLAPPVPERTCVDRSPVRISRISMLVEDAPEYYYNFGHISISDSHIELNTSKNTNEKDPNSPAKPMKFSEKLSKQYKELSEFKFKHILGKKTVVRTTSIEVENYSHRPEDLMSERSDFDFEFRSLPAGTGGSFEVDPESSPESSVVKRLSKEKTERNSNIRSSESLQTVSNIEPNESSLWKHMNTLTRKNTVQKSNDNNGEEQAEKSEKNTGISKMSFKKQNFEEACNRAKTTVTNKLQKLKSFQERIMDPKSASNSASEDSKTKNRPDSESTVPMASSNPEASVYGRSKFSMKRTLGRPQPNAWKGESVKQTSIDCDRYTGRRCLKSEDSVDSDDRSVITIRPAPPIPSSKRVAPKERPGLPSDIRKISVPRPARPVTPDESSWRGHLRKPSSESVDSDAWIPDAFKGPTRNQINLDIMGETSNGWAMSKPLKRHEFQKSTSIDIFNRKGDEAFEDFDDVLRNVPTVPIRNDSSNPKPKLDKPKPLVLQTAIAKEIDPIPDEERSFHFNKLISRFEDSSKSTNGSSNGSLDSYPEHMTSFESKIIVHRGNVREYDDNDVGSMQAMPQQGQMRNANVNNNGANKYPMHGRAPQLKYSCKSDELASSVEDDIDSDIFHSLDYNEYNPVNDSIRRYRLNSVKVVYSIDV